MKCPHDSFGVTCGELSSRETLGYCQHHFVRLSRRRREILARAMRGEPEPPPTRTMLPASRLFVRIWAVAITVAVAWMMWRMTR